jgi:hypothetical protein
MAALGVAVLGADRLGTDAETILALAALAAGGALLMRHRPGVALLTLTVIAIALLRAERTGEIYAERTFFGVSRVQETEQFHELISGTTMHGRQALDDPDGRRPLAYYAVGGPISQVLDAARSSAALDVGVIGLGAGSLAAYGRSGDHFTFYEIDPAVIRIAQDPALFSFLSSSTARIDVQLGDGRKLVERARGAPHGLLVIDAFSSDAIPVHLLTREAVQVYRSHLQAQGVVAIHVSNRFFDLVPALAALARDAGWDALVNGWNPPADAPAGAAPTTWVVLGPPGGLLDELDSNDGWASPVADGAVWTDDHADLLATLEVTR